MNLKQRIPLIIVFPFVLFLLFDKHIFSILENEENKDLINIELLLLNILNKYKSHHRCSKDYFQIIYNYLLKNN